MDALRKCDVVMQGGVTSGIVYPGLVCKLAEHYQFQQIGGTSAGAIAAALTAAAEYTRWKDKIECKLRD
jgi:predicted acylesterase/phospholipase RssA